MPPLLNTLYHPYRGRMVLDEKAVAYKNDTRWQCVLQMRAQGIYDPLDGDLMLDIQVYRPRQGKRKGDIDSTLKCLLDSLQEVVYADDDQVVKLILEKHSDPANPRVEIMVTIRG